VNASTALHDFRAVAGTHASFDFSVYGFSFDLHLTASGFEQIRTVVIADPNPAPVAYADANTINEDGSSNAVAGNVLPTTRITALRNQVFPLSTPACGPAITEL
jgi:hypothetical protein